MAALDALAAYLQSDDDLMTLLEVRRIQALADPLVRDRHEALGDLLSTLGLYGQALPEYQKVLFLNPFDRATAHFKMAQSLHSLQRKDDALRELLLALEIADQRAESTLEAALRLGWGNARIERDVFGRRRYLLATRTAVG